jgi:hypothetical protein
MIMHEFTTLISGAAEIPVSILFGQAYGRGMQGGSTGGGLGDARTYYDNCRTKQKNDIAPRLGMLDQLLMRSALGRADPNIHYEWKPLWQMDDDEKAKIALAKAQSTQIYATIGIINEDALREGVVNQLIEDGFYPGLDDAIEEYGSEPEEPEDTGGYVPGQPGEQPPGGQPGGGAAPPPKTAKPSVGAKLGDYNPHHAPKGTSEGGEFTSSEGGSGSEPPRGLTPAQLEAKGYTTFYHGTSADNVASIRKNGIRSEGETVSLSISKLQAGRWGETKYPGKKIAVIKVDLGKSTHELIGGGANDDQYRHHGTISPGSIKSVLSHRIGDARDAFDYSPDQPRGVSGPGTTPGSFTSGGGSSGAAEGAAAEGAAAEGAAAEGAAAEGAHPGKGYSKQAKLVNGVIQTSNVNDAVRALYEGRKVNLDQPRQVSTLLGKLASVAKEMEKLGAKAHNFNLCDVTVTGSNLFCSESKGIPRVKMPQLPDAKAFQDHLEKTGVKVTNADEFASYLRATQDELNGVKVGGMMKAMREGKVKEERMIVSRDNYVVDGHHRWASKVGIDSENNKLGDIKMPVARVDMDIIPLLEAADKFTGGAGHKGVGDRRRTA